MNARPDAELVGRLRNRTLTALHSGRLGPGDRLASVRILAAEMDVDPRMVMAAYRLLEREGLVEIRPRSGVYVARWDSGVTGLELEIVRWITDVALGAWQRRIPIPRLHERIRECVASETFVCACVDEIEDERFAICKEVGRDFGLKIRSLEPLASGGVRVEGREETLRAGMEGADIVLVTVYHEREVRPVAEDLGLPLVVCTLNPDRLSELIEVRDRSEATSFVVVDPRAEARLVEAFGDGIKVLTASDLTPEALVDLVGGVVFTDAAADAWGDLPEHVVVPHAPLISRESAARLLAILAPLHLAAAERAASRLTGETV